MGTITLQPAKSRHWHAFFLAMLTAALIFLPFVIYNRGLFIYIGDFNVQQIPFYKLAHEAVRSGDIFWNWYTDLGANFIGSYSFYLFFSPFFWLTLPFPTEWLPYLMAPLFVLKTGCAALTSYCYISRFVRDKNYAVIGALLYAFSGFTAYNIFFNHFHEVIVFFPLMLVGLEELLVSNRRGLFALAVAVNALVNYWFFVGEVVFVILYFIVRCTGLRGAWKKFFLVAFEGLLGTLCAAVALLPSALAVMGNPRTTLPDNMLGGWQFWLYTHEQRQPGIVASFFFPPETPSRPNMFPDHGAKWASLSAWLPLFSMSGVLGFLFTARKNWLKKLLLILFFIALVPGLNSLFVGFNHSYYTRWFYMLILLMCVATAVALENKSVDIARGFRWTLIVTLGTVLAIGLTPVLKDGAVEKIGLAKDMNVFWVYAAMAAVSLLLCYVLLVFVRNREDFARRAIALLCAFCLCYTALYIGMSKQTPDGDNFIIDNGVLGRESISLPRTSFYRTDIYDSGDNFGMYWHLPNIQAFHSIVPVSIMEFYPQVGVKRDVSSRPQSEYYALRSLFSVKYLFIGQDKEDQEPMPGYRLLNQQLSFNVYENTNYLPMGIAFDAYVDENDWNTADMDDRHTLLARALYLSDEQIERHDDILDHALVRADTDFSYDAFERDVARRRETCAYFFETDTRGFTAKSRLEEESLMFFSVPWEAGWSATVNGAPAEIERVDIGFMAVRVPAGEATIRFDYMTPGLLLGLVTTGSALVLLAAYMFLFRATLRRPKSNRRYELFDDSAIPEAPAPREHVRLPGDVGRDVSWDEEAFTGSPDAASAAPDGRFHLTKPLAPEEPAPPDTGDWLILKDGQTIPNLPPMSAAEKLFAAGYDAPPEELLRFEEDNRETLTPPRTPRTNAPMIDVPRVSEAQTSAPYSGAPEAHGNATRTEKETRAPQPQTDAMTGLFKKMESGQDNGEQLSQADMLSALLKQSEAEHADKGPRLPGKLPPKPPNRQPVQPLYQPKPQADAPKLVTGQLPATETPQKPVSTPRQEAGQTRQLQDDMLAELLKKTEPVQRAAKPLGADADEASPRGTRPLGADGSRAYSFGTEPAGSGVLPRSAKPVATDGTKPVGTDGTEPAGSGVLPRSAKPVATDGAKPSMTERADDDWTPPPPKNSGATYSWDD